MISWADGLPEVLAKQFHSAAGDVASSLGKVPFYWFVAAAACASVHNVMATSPSERERSLKNILATAHAITQAVIQRGVDEDEDAYDDYEEEDEDLQLTVSICSGAQLAMPKAMRELESLVKKLLQQEDKQPGSASVKTDAESAAGNGLSLPAPLVQAYRHMLCAFIDSVGEFTDGSSEAELVLKWPLDGSAAGGRDLKEDADVRTFRSLMPMMADLIGIFGAAPDALSKFKATMKGRDAIKQPPDSKSTPLSSFVSSKPVPFNSSISAAVAQEPCIEFTPGTGRNRGRFASETSTPRPAIPAPPNDVFTAACCDIQFLPDITMGHEMHLDGDLLCHGYQHGWKQRDPGFAAAVVKSRTDADTGAVFPVVKQSSYNHGLFDSVRRTCADSANGLVWCAADIGRRIKAFRAPEQLGSRSVDAACNRGEGNGMCLQYTFNTDVTGFGGEHAGLHVIGTKVICTKTGGAMFTWDISDLEPQKKQRSEDPLDPEAADSEDGDDKEERFKGDLGWRDMDACMDLEVSVGTKPHAIFRLQRPSSSDDIKGSLHMGVNRTVLLSSRAVPDTLAVIRNTAIMTYDLQTHQIKNLFFGHLYDIEALCPAPAAWPGAESLFATCARSGDVKLWDVRSKGGAAVVTLETSLREPMTAVALAANSNSSAAATAGASSSSNQLGAGMICFAGGGCESVWAWDLRGGNAQVLYELSSGNLRVDELVWHEGTSTLIAACDSMYEDRFGSCYRDDFMRLTADGNVPDPLGNSSSDDEEEGLDQDDGGKLWPKKAKHDPKDFRKYFHASCSCVLGYTFSDRASQIIPPTTATHFGSYGGW